MKRLPIVSNSSLQQARALITSIVETVREPLVVLDETLCVQKANHRFYQMFCLSEQETEGRSIYDLAGGAWNAPTLRALLKEVLNDNRAFEDFELESDFPQGKRKILCINGQRLGDSEMILMSVDNITARRNAEVELQRIQEELRQGQKMEVIGRLASGIAHDFNNMLTAILGFSEMLVEELEKGTEQHHEATEIKKASERAAALTRQLLAFSRRQVLFPQALSLNSAIRELEQMLRRLINDDIVLEIVLDEELCLVRADPGQISQMILNLALNARDAMPQGGVLSIRTENAPVDGIGKRARDLAPGSYVRLTVTDSGTGIDRETQRHIFEPFFTTKSLGSGTGLGLATVLGIVEQSSGRIQFSSELDRGTSFWVDLPRVEGTPASEVRREYTTMPTGTETVLVVDDEEVVRELTTLLLRRQGYTVLAASHPSAGLSLCRSYPEKIDLLLTDLLMPGRMNGLQLAKQAIEIRAGVRVLLMSGYTTDALVRRGVDENVGFLQKPFTLQDLARKVREVLDTAPVGVPGLQCRAGHPE
jgi:signal transduction histidine kinase/ActR/RegA family two-component response regulator